VSIELYDATIPVFVNAMRNLTTHLAKAESWAVESKVAPATLIEARLISDMLPLNRQVHIVSDSAKGAAARLAGVEIPGYPDTETTFAELKERLAKTIAFVDAIKPEQVNGNEGRSISLKFGSLERSFSAKDFVFQFALPNFMFHVVTAYDIMRAQGVPLGKLEYLFGVKS
jgi:hypothetical protein